MSPDPSFDQAEPAPDSGSVSASAAGRVARWADSVCDGASESLDEGTFHDGRPVGSPPEGINPLVGRRDLRKAGVEVCRGSIGQAALCSAAFSRNGFVLPVVGAEPGNFRNLGRASRLDQAANRSAHLGGARQDERRDRQDSEFETENDRQISRAHLPEARRREPHRGREFRSRGRIMRSNKNARSRGKRSMA